MKRHTSPLRWHHSTPQRGILLTLMICAAWLGSCGRGPESIPEDVMRDIMRDALISQSIMYESNDKSLRPMDSLNLHSRVIARYDYTMDDFRFTIREMSMRKSNPLAQILTGVAEDMKTASKLAEIRFKAYLRADSVAQARTADTVFRSDTILSGKIHGYKIVYTGVVPEDSVVERGTYRLIFDYSTGQTARAYTKSIVSKQRAEGKRVIENTLWLPVAKDTSHYAENIEVGYDVKMLEISMKETRRNKSKPDTCYVANILLVHLLPVKEARILFTKQLTGFEPIKELYEKRYLDSLQKLGGAIPPRIKWEINTQCCDSLRPRRDSSEHRAVR